MASWNLKVWKGKLKAFFSCYGIHIKMEEKNPLFKVLWLQTPATLFKLPETKENAQWKENTLLFPLL